MGLIRAKLVYDTYFKRTSIQIEGVGNYTWIERFVQNCASEAMLQSVVDALQDARKANSGWTCNYNDIVAHYDPPRQLILARHELDDIAVPPPSTMPVVDFLRILAIWKEALSQTRDE